MRNPPTLLLSQAGLLLTATSQLIRRRQSRPAICRFVALTFLVAAFDFLSSSTLSEGLTFGLAAAFLFYVEAAERL